MCVRDISRLAVGAFSYETLEESLMFYDYRGGCNKKLTVIVSRSSGSADNGPTNYGRGQPHPQTFHSLDSFDCRKSKVSFRYNSILIPI